MDIQTKLTALQAARAQFKQASAHRTLVQKEKRLLESQIREYLTEHNLPRVKNEKLSIVANSKKLRKRLSKTEKIEQGIEALKNLGVADPKKVYESLQESLKGEAETVSSIHVKEL